MRASVLLGEVIDVASGQVDPRVDPYSDLPHVGGDNIESGSGRLFGVRTARELNLISGKYEFGPDDVLYSKIRPALNKVALPDFVGICSADMYPLRSRPARIERRYLAYLLRHDDFLSYAEKHSSRTNIPKINRDTLLNYEVRLPPLTEQRHIADILDNADAIRRKRKGAIALTEELLRSTFLEMFGDPVTNPKGWPLKPLGDLLEFLTSGSRGWAQHYTDTGDAFLRIQNVRRDRLDLSDVAYVQAPDSAEARRTHTRPGDVLLSITADLGRTAVVPPSLDRAFINQHLAILRPEHIDPEFLSAFLASEGGQIQINGRNKGGVKAGLNFDDIRSIEVPVPTSKAQQAYAEAKVRIRGLQLQLSRSFEQSEALFNSLVSRAFSGSLDATC